MISKNLRFTDIMTLRTRIRNISGTLQQTIVLKILVIKISTTPISNIIAQENCISYQHNFTKCYENGIFGSKILSRIVRNKIPQYSFIQETKMRSF